MSYDRLYVKGFTWHQNRLQGHLIPLEILFRHCVTRSHTNLGQELKDRGVSPNAYIYLFVYLWFYVAFNTVQVISRQVVGRAEETSTYSSSGFCTVNGQPTASNYQLPHLRPCRDPNPSIRAGRRECYHSATMPPPPPPNAYNHGL